MGCIGAGGAAEFSVKGACKTIYTAKAQRHGSLGDGDGVIPQAESRISQTEPAGIIRRRKPVCCMKSRRAYHGEKCAALANWSGVISSRRCKAM